MIRCTLSYLVWKYLTEAELFTESGRAVGESDKYLKNAIKSIGLRIYSTRVHASSVRLNKLSGNNLVFD